MPWTPGWWLTIHIIFYHWKEDDHNYEFRENLCSLLEFLHHFGTDLTASLFGDVSLTRKLLCLRHSLSPEQCKPMHISLSKNYQTYPKLHLRSQFYSQIFSILLLKLLLHTHLATTKNRGSQILCNANFQRAFQNLPSEESNQRKSTPNNSFMVTTSMNW